MEELKKMSIEELVKSVRNDVTQGAYDDAEILLLCGKVEELLQQKKQNNKPQKPETSLLRTQKIKIGKEGSL